MLLFSRDRRESSRALRDAPANVLLSCRKLTEAARIAHNTQIGAVSLFNHFVDRSSLSKYPFVFSHTSL